MRIEGLNGNVNSIGDDNERVESLGPMPTGVLTMTTTDLKRSFLRVPRRLVVLATLWTLLASFTGTALVEQTEKHATDDRLSFGTTADTCIRAACSSSHPLD